MDSGNIFAAALAASLIVLFFLVLFEPQSASGDKVKVAGGLPNPAPIAVVKPEPEVTAPYSPSAPAPAADDPAAKWDSLFNQTAPEEGVVLPARWGDVGPKLLSSGVMDYGLLDISMRKSGRPLSAGQERIVREGSGENVTITRENRVFVLSMFWALGLANENPVITAGPLSNTPDVPRDRFASTGGWGLSRRNVNDLVSSARIITLSPRQQEIVESVAKKTYRPCCDNPTYFPDCNHGMAALGLAELLASQNASEEQVMRAVLYANAYWFPQNYLDIAEYFRERGNGWRDVNASAVLGAEYSSASGYERIRKSLREKPVLRQDATSC